jgi:hypothetical protein
MYYARVDRAVALFAQRHQIVEIVKQMVLHAGIVGSHEGYFVVHVLGRCDTAVGKAHLAQRLPPQLLGTQTRPTPLRIEPMACLRLESVSRPAPFG